MNEYDLIKPAYEAMARKMMNDHNLENVAFGWNRGKRRMGFARSRAGIPILLSVSQYALDLPAEDFHNLILHEIAHLLTPGHGHDWVWKAKAREIGCTGDRCITIADEHRQPHNFRVYCPNGHWSVFRYRAGRLTGRRCKCGAIVEVEDLR